MSEDHVQTKTTVDCLRQTAAEFPDREAYVAGDGVLTYGSWDAAADALAYSWQRLGLRKGDVVALILPSCLEYPVCYQAAMRLGAMTTGINPRSGRTEVDSIIERTRARIAVVADDLPTPKHAATVLRCSELATVPSGDAATGFADILPTDPVAIVWTGGTTGRPKGAVFTHRQLAAVAASASALTARFGRKLSPTPFSHIGYMVHMWEEIENLITVVIPPTPWKAARVLELMGRARVTVGQGVAAQWRLMFDSAHFASTDLSALRIAGTGGSAIPPDLVMEMRERLGCPVVVGYASTESGILSETTPADNPDLMNSTVGRARPNVELDIVDDQGRPLPADSEGRVRCRSVATMDRYWDDPAGTAAVLDRDGWLTVGDLGRMDVNGNLTLLGRDGEMYIRGGYNVYPAEVERLLAMHPAVGQVAVVGQPDPVLGEIGRAFIVPAQGRPVPDLTELRAWCADDLADYKGPDRAEYVEELPLTRMGKVDKKVLSLHANSAAQSERQGHAKA